MGDIYSVACKQCKVTRDLDKFYSSGHEVETRREALGYSKIVKSDSFRAGLLISFMNKHRGHDCVFFMEHDGCADDLDPFYEDKGYKEDTDFWKKE